MRVIGKRFREKKHKRSPMRQLTQKVVGKQMVILCLGNNYQINPRGTGTKAIDPDTEQVIISGLVFPTRGRFPIPPPEITQAGILVSYRGF